MTEQMTIFDFIDEPINFNMCSGCVHAKFKEHTQRAGDLWFCGEMHTYITEKTFDWICKKSRGRSLYERRK